MGSVVASAATCRESPQTSSWRFPRVATLGNAAGVGQLGANHYAVLSQDGNGNIAAGVQVGNGCNAVVSQTGAGNVAAFDQACP